MIQPRNKTLIVFSVIAVNICAGSVASAAESESKWHSRFGGNLGLSYDVGRMGNGPIGLPERTVNNINFEALPGYRFGKLLLGIDAEYFYQRQFSTTNKTGGTNLRGSGYLLGVGANYLVSPKFAVQGSVRFLGQYDFANQTDTSRDDHLSEPFGGRIKLQYMPSERLPLSLDVGAQYTKFGSVTVDNNDRSSSTSFWSAGIGVTYHFGSRKPYEATVPAPVVEPVAAPVLKQSEELAQVVDVKQTERGDLVNVAGDLSFAPMSSDLKESSRESLAKAGQILAKNPKNRIKIEGYSDTSGSKAKNLELSEGRAEAVKQILVDNGVPADQITTEGMGSVKPIADNKTAEGRSANRRVEIYISSDEQ